MIRIILALAIVIGMCQAAINPMSQDILKSYIEKGAPFDFLLIDVRSKGEVTVAIGNDACKPYNLPFPVYFMPESRKIPKDLAIIVYCQSGARSARAAGFLSANGYNNVYDAGGMMTWTGPTIPASEIKPATLLPEPSMRATSTDLIYGSHPMKRFASLDSRRMQDTKLFLQSRRPQ